MGTELNKIHTVDNDCDNDHEECYSSIEVDKKPESNHISLNISNQQANQKLLLNKQQVNSLILALNKHLPQN